MLTRPQLEAAARVLGAMAHPLRLGILQVLADGEKTVTELYGKLDCSQPLMSQQLRLLEAQNLVQARKEGASRYYSIRNDDFLKLFACMENHLRQYFRV
ncbi:MAG TPA: metalloregulator ArsR/SmtB family transcription factor [Planctomycetota bacterium]|nr:metalloregulator ArsR/SmtB family transcription factor [Planctomycetota bacterium]